MGKIGVCTNLQGCRTFGMPNSVYVLVSFNFFASVLSQHNELRSKMRVGVFFLILPLLLLFCFFYFFGKAI